MSERFYEIAVLIGSLREKSLNRSMAQNLKEFAPSSLNFQIVEIGDLPLYNPDLEGKVPTWDRFREELEGVDGLLFLTPEYNRSVPAALKNAVDIGSRSKSFFGLPGAVISLSPGKMGGFGANHHLRQTLVFVNVAVMAQPEAYLGGALDFFDDEGTLVKESAREFMATFMTAFEEWVKTHRRDEK